MCYGKSDGPAGKVAGSGGEKLALYFVLLVSGLEFPLSPLRAQTASRPPAQAELPAAASAHFAAGERLLAQHTPKLAEVEIRAGLKLAPQSLEGLNLLGMALEEQKDFAGAVEAFCQALKIDPQSTETQLKLTETYLGAGQKEKGLELARSLSEQAKNDVRPHFTLAVLLARLGEYKAAIHEFETADALQPGTFEILHNLGQAYLKSGDNAKALGILDRALKLSPNSVGTLYLMAQAYANEGKDLDALDVLVKARKLEPRNTDVIFLMARLSMKQTYYEDAIPLLEEGLKVDPNGPNLLAALGICYFATGKITKAKDTFQALLQVNRSARAYALMGLCYRYLGRFDEAEKYLEQGLNADPRDAACLFNMGYIESRQGHYDSGEKWLKQALEVDPDYYEALLELGNAKMRQKKFEEAVPLLRKCAQLDPHPGPVYFRLASAERSLHQTEAAERDLKIFQTLSKDPTHEPSAFQHLYDYLGQRAELPLQQKNLNDLEQLQQEVKLHADEPQNLYLLAEAYLKLGRVQEAKQAIAQLEQLSQSDFRTTVGVGVLLARYHLYSEAIAHFQQALQSNPNSDDLWYDFADANFRKRDYADALAAARRVSAQGQKDTNYLALLADILAHLGQYDEAAKLLRQDIGENPDQDQAYLSLALVHLRAGNPAPAREILQQGLARTPDAGELLWGMGVVSVMEGQEEKAEEYLRKSVELLPQWPGSYSALALLYFQTGQIAKARETTERFRQGGPGGGLDVQRIEQALSAAANSGNERVHAFTPQARQQFLQMALAHADQAP
jgi:tetratricopeptide (TPR) repeat protein